MSLKKIAAGVALFHLLVFLGFGLYKPALPMPVVSPRLMVKTVVLEPLKGEAASSDKPLPQKPVTMKPKPVEHRALDLKPEKKEVVKAAPKKVKAAPEKKEKEPPGKKIDAEKVQLLAQARDKIANIGKKRDNINREKSESCQVAMVEQLQIDEMAIQKPSYQGSVAVFLRQRLRLPEEGAVTVTLTLAKNGQVLQVAIEQADSQLNRHYVVTVLPSLQFPRFEDLSERTLTLTLTHEI